MTTFKDNTYIISPLDGESFVGEEHSEEHTNANGHERHHGHSTDEATTQAPVGRPQHLHLRHQADVLGFRGIVRRRQVVHGVLAHRQVLLEGYNSTQSCVSDPANGYREGLQCNTNLHLPLQLRVQWVIRSERRDRTRASDRGHIVAVLVGNSFKVRTGSGWLLVVVVGGCKGRGGGRNE